jgi:hypothetical protein
MATVLALFAVAMALCTSSALAATTSVILTAGPVNVSSAAVDTVTSVPLDGSVKSASVPLKDLTVTDATGTGAGWHLAVQATPLAAGGRYLPAGSLRFCFPGLDSKDRLNPSHLQAASGACLLDSVSAVIITSAAPGGTGMGSFSSGASAIMVNVPANASAGTYQSTVFISLITGP